MGISDAIFSKVFIYFLVNYNIVKFQVVAQCMSE